MGLLTKQIKSFRRLVMMGNDNESAASQPPAGKDDEKSTKDDDEKSTKDDDEKSTMAEPSNKVYFAIALSETMEQLEWATQATFTTTLFLKLGASAELASLAWLPSPMLSLFLAPYFGHLSDGCTHKWGRRRIFLAGISIFIVGGLITIPLAAEYISNQRLALIIVIIANFTVDVANQLFDQTQRALAFDLTPKKYQPKVHSIIATSVGFGNVLGSFLGFIDYSFLNADVNDEMFLFLIGCGLFILGLPPILIFAKEEPLILEEVYTDPPLVLDGKQREAVGSTPDSEDDVNIQGTLLEPICEFAAIAENLSEDDSLSETSVDRKIEAFVSTRNIAPNEDSDFVTPALSSANDQGKNPPPNHREKNPMHPSVRRGSARTSLRYSVTRRRSSFTQALIDTLVLKEPMLLSRKTKSHVDKTKVVLKEPMLLSKQKSKSVVHAPAVSKEQMLQYRKRDSSMAYATQFAPRRMSTSPFLLDVIDVAVREEHREYERRMTLALSAAAVGPVSPTGNENNDPLSDSDATHDQKGIVEFYRNTPLPFFVVCFCQFLSYSAVIVYFTYTTSYFAVNIYGGDPLAELGTEENELYTAGVRQGALASCWVSMLSSITAAFIPTLVKLLGVRNTFCGAQAVGGICWIGAYFVRQPWPTTALMGGMGFVWATCTTIPYLFLGKYVAPANVGFAVGILSICQLSFSVLIVSTTFGTFIRLAGNDFGLALLIGAVFVFISGAIQWFVPYKTDDDEEKKTRESNVLVEETNNAMDSTTMSTSLRTAA